MLNKIKTRLSGPTGSAFFATLAVLAVLVGVRSFDPDLVQTARLAVFDAYQRAAPRPYQPVPVRVVTIDDESLARIGQWPWPRRVTADLLTRLNQLGAAVIVTDIVWPEPDRTSPRRVLEQVGDTALTGPLQAALDGLPDFDQVLGVAIANSNVVTAFVPVRTANVNQPPQKKGLAVVGPNPAPYVEAFTGAIVNLPEIDAGALGHGSMSAPPRDGDEVFRRIPMLQNINGEIYPSLSLETVRALQGDISIRVRVTDQGQAGITAIQAGQAKVPVDRSGHFRLHYTASVPERNVPAWQIMNPEVDNTVKQKIAGHIVLIGAAAAALGDLRSTPIEPLTPGVFIHAQAIEQILLGWQLIRPDWAIGAEIFGTAALGFILAFLLAWMRPVWAGLIGVALIAAIQAAAWFAYTDWRFLVDPVFPSVALLAVYIIGSFVRYLFTEREKRFVRAAFSSYVSPNLVDHFIEHPEDLELGGERRECSFVMTDLAGFTTMVEKSDPSSLVFLLNGYLDEMTRIAFEHDGTLDRIVGDAVAVMFSAPVIQEDHAERAVACALEMDAFSEDYRKRMNEEGYPLGITRIGVHTGQVIIGNVGGAQHSDYRALGDAINTAARLESVNKQLGTRICISGATTSLCPDFDGRPIGDLVLKGKSQGVQTFDPLTPASSIGSTAYMAAFDMMAREDPAAKDAFAKLTETDPDDPLAKFHLARLTRGQTGARIVFDEK